MFVDVDGISDKNVTYVRRSYIPRATYVTPEYVGGDVVVASAGGTLSFSYTPKAKFEYAGALSAHDAAQHQAAQCIFWGSGMMRCMVEKALQTREREAPCTSEVLLHLLSHFTKSD